MTAGTSAAEIRGFFDRLIEIAQRKREAREDLADIKLEDPLKKIDWTRLMALAAAYDADLHDEKNRGRVEKLISAATYASWYADILKFGKDEQNSQIRSSSPKSQSVAMSAPKPAGDGALEDPAGVASGNEAVAAVEGAVTASAISDSEGIPDFLRRPFVTEADAKALQEILDAG